MITQREISKIAFREKMSDKVIEKDYCLTWLLFGIAESQRGKSLNKGGTALKKIYFPNQSYNIGLSLSCQQLRHRYGPKTLIQLDCFTAVVNQNGSDACWCSGQECAQAG